VSATNDGCLGGRATYAVLIAVAGRYATLYVLQAAGYQPCEAASPLRSVAEADQG
jgi:hypothetical protein